MTTTGARRGRMETGRLSNRQAAALAPRIDGTCASCGGPLSKVLSADGDYWVCGLPHEFGVAQRCAGIRRADGSVIPPEPPLDWSLPF